MRASPELLLTILTWAFVSSPSFAVTREMPTLTILADSTLSIPVSQIATQYSRTNDVSVSAIYQSPSAHQQSIENGDPADLLITADATLVERLGKKGLTDVKSPTVVAFDNLVLAASQSADEVTIPQNIFSDKTLQPLQGYEWVLLSPEAFVEGAAAQTFLSKAAKEEYYSNNLSLSPSIQDALSTLQEKKRVGIIPSALLTGTDARSIADLPPEASKIEYTGLVVASENMEKARALLAYMASDEAKAILNRCGLKQAD